MHKKKIILVTNQYPYGTSEGFLDEEINFLSRSLEEIYLLPTKKIDGLHQRAIPENVQVISWSPSTIFEINFRVLSVLIFYTLKNFFRAGRFSFSQMRSALLSSLSLARRFSGIFLALKRQPAFSSEKSSHVICYHYWRESYLLATHLFFKEQGRTSVVLSRAHEYDIFAQDREYPLKFVLEKIPQKVYSVSSKGREYLIEHLRHTTEQVEVSRLGVKAHSQLAPLPRLDCIHIITISAINRQKRLDLLARALQGANRKVLWTVIGDGNEMDLLKQELGKLPSCVRVDLRGWQTKEQLYTFLGDAQVDFLVNVSSTEGVPVSMMECLSFGIPILATDVGGVSELVTDKVGVLLDPSSESVENKLVEVLEKAKANFYGDGGKAIRERCKDSFSEKWDSEVNYRNFLERIHSLSV